MQDFTETIYFGSYTRASSQGIYEASFYQGQLENIKVLASLKNPTYLALDKKANRLISVAELSNKSGLAVIDLLPEHQGEILSYLEYSDHVPCYVSYDPENSLIYTANYHDAILSVLSLGKDGQIHLIDQVQHVGKGPHPNQEKAHIHFACPHPFTEGILCCDLGSDLISHYRLDKEMKLTKISDLSLKAGSGPRHLAFHPQRKVAYLLSELTSEVTVLPFNLSTSAFQIASSYSLLPDKWTDFNSGAAIHLSQDGRFLYASNRGHNSIVVFSISPDGLSLKKIQCISSGDDFPRDFQLSIDNHWLICGHQKGLTRIFKRDPKTGLLKLLPDIYPIPECVCVLPSPLD